MLRRAHLHDVTTLVLVGPAAVNHVRTKALTVTLLLAAMMAAGCTSSPAAQPSNMSGAPPGKHAQPPPALAPARPPASSSPGGVDHSSPGPAVVYRAQVRGTVNVSANIPDAVLGGTDVLAGSVHLDPLPPANLTRLEVSFSWAGGTAIGDAGLWLWDDSNGPGTTDYVVRMVAANGATVNATIDGSAWHAVGTPHFLTGSVGGGGAAASGRYSFVVTLVGYR